LPSLHGLGRPAGVFLAPASLKPLPPFSSGIPFKFPPVFPLISSRQPLAPHKPWFPTRNTPLLSWQLRSLSSSCERGLNQVRKQQLSTRMGDASTIPLFPVHLPPLLFPDFPLALFPCETQDVGEYCLYTVVILLFS